MSAVVNHGIFFNNKVGTSKTIKKTKKQKIKQTYFYNKVGSSKTTQQKTKTKNIITSTV